MMELQVVLPEPSEYKDDVPLPMLSGQPTPAQQAILVMETLFVQKIGPSWTLWLELHKEPKLKEPTVFSTVLSMCLLNLFP